MGRGMGGGAPFPYPKWVWTPTGGWYCNPHHWQRNTAVVGLGICAIMAVVSNFSRNNERRPMPPMDVGSCPSQSWCKHAVEDDPRLAPSTNPGYNRGAE